MDKEEFYQYVLSFYNAKDGIYPDVAATYGEVVEATRELIVIYEAQGEYPCFDSADREWVRDEFLRGRK